MDSISSLDYAKVYALVQKPSLDSLCFHGVIVHGSESRNKSMAVHIQNPHENCKVEGIAQEMSLSHWKGKAEWFETLYLKRCGVITSDVNVLVHVHPLKGLKHLESGALVKDYEGPEKELEQAVQMVISEVASEDPRFPKKDAPPLSEEFPDGTNIFFLGEHIALSVVLAFFLSDKTENNKFKIIVDNRISQYYLPSFKAASTIRIRLVIIGSLARRLIHEYKDKFPGIFVILDQGGDDIARTTDIFDSHADAGVKESTVKEIEQVADDVKKNRSKAGIKKAIVKNIPRHAVLKPLHAIYRLQNQCFALGDRVTMVQDSGGVPLSAKGVVIGLNTKSMDVVWDVPFMSGTTLGDRYTVLMLTLDDKV
ncbi:hypothetical protein BDR07DRAFT_1382532 [Suillus spraguei]|nr:hypothetical protein BDR07DRAFT_1382532 [Suillus spraguei]